MENDAIVAALHKMVDDFGNMLKNPLFSGTMPLIRLACKPDADGDCLRLHVGCDFVNINDSES
jgi:hypothetical protein